MSDASRLARSSFYRPELDGLRFFAFLAVFVSHAFSQSAEEYGRAGLPSAAAFVVARVVQSGGNGLLLFFVLSSYLITTLLLREREREGHISVGDFYARRALRIWPLYYVFVLGTFLLVPQGSVAAMQHAALPGYLLFLANWHFLIPAVRTAPGAAGPLWSVSVEEQFYLVWPFVVRRFNVKRVAVGLVAFALLVRVAMVAWGAGKYALWYNSFGWGDAIGAGALLALAFRRRLPSFSPRTRIALFALGFGMWVADASLYTKGLSYSIVAPANLAASVVIFCSALGARGFVASPALAYLGRISYGLYVYHQAALFVAEKLLPSSRWQAALALCLTVVVSVASYHIFESPFLKLKRRFTHVPSRPVEGEPGLPVAEASAAP